MENFGLGLVLQFTDHASVGIGRVANTISSLEQTARSASGIMNSLGQSMNALGSIGMTLSATVTAPLSGFLNQIMSWGVQRASSVQQLQISFETLMGSARDASDYLDKVMAYAKTTPYAFDDLAQVAQNLIAFGVDANTVLDQTGDKFGGIMQALGDWSGASATGVQGMSEVAYVLAQVSSLGKVDQKILNRLNMRGLRAAQIIGNIHGMTEDAAANFIKTSMTADEFISDLIKGIEEGTEGVNGSTAAMAGMVEKIKGTWVGAQDSFRSALKNAGLSLMGTFKDENGITHYKFLDSMTDSLNRISDSIKKISTVFQPLIDFVESVIVKATELIQKIATAYAELDDETKKRIGNVVATLVLLGPALILFSQFGKLILRTVGFLRTFTTTMGMASLVTATALFAMTTNFGGMRTSLVDFIDGISKAFGLAFELIGKGSELTEEEIKKLQKSDEWVDRLTAKFAKIIGFIKVMSDAWSDFTISEENFQLMEALGITPFVESLLTLKDRMSYFLQGMLAGFNSFVKGVKDAVKGTFLEDIFNMLLEIFTMLKYGDRQFFYDLGETFGKILPVIIAIRGLLPVITVVAGGLRGIITLTSSAVGGVLNLVSSFTSQGGNIIKLLTGASSTASGGGLFAKLFASSAPIAGAEAGGAAAGVAGAGASLGVILAVVLAIVSALVALYTTSEDFRNVVNNVVTSLLPPIVDFIGSLMSALKAFWEYLKIVWNFVKPILTAVLIPVVEILGAIFRTLLEVWTAILDTFTAIVTPLADFVNQLFDMIGLSIDLSDVWKVLSSVFKGIGYVIEFAIVTPITAVLNIVIAIMKGITWILNKIPGINIKSPEWLKFPWQKSNKKAEVTFDEETPYESSDVLNSLEGAKPKEQTVRDWFGEGFSLENSDTIAKPKENPESENEVGLIDKVKSTFSSLTNKGVEDNSLTNNNNSNTSSYNVNFSEGSIVINAGNNISEQSARDFAKVLANMIAQQIKINAMATQDSEMKNVAENMAYVMSGGAV